MDVTCPACNTRYEFDEALVSSKGTTVKCTNCGHQFKVYRPDGASGLDGWVVRTTDGRELKFKAMRELQAAITSSRVSREDVLIPRDGAEPRRLGRIEELQSFFSLGEEVVPTTRRRRDTPTGHHDTSQELVKTKVRGSGTTEESVTRAHASSSVDREGEPVPARSGKTLRPPRSDSGRLKHGEGPPPEPRTLPRAEGLPPDVRERFDSEISGERPPPVSPRPERRRSTKLGRERPAKPPGLPPDRPTQVRNANPHASRHGQLDAVEAFNDAVRAELGPSSLAEASAPRSPPSDLGFDDVTNPRGRPYEESGEVPLETDEDTIGDADAAEAIVAAAIGPKSSGPISSEAPVSGRLSDEIRISDPPETPSPSAARPSVLRRSEVHSDPRFSGYAPRGKRPGLARWVVGIIGLGVIAVAGFTLVKRVRPPEDQVPTAAANDSRVDKFLQEGETRLAEGDVEGAKDHFNKASGVTEADPRVWRALARIAIVQADLLWLELEVLDKSAEGRGSLEQRLKRAVERARASVDHAVKLAGDDPLTVSVHIDVLRLEGKPLDARKLAPKVDGAGPDADRARALLDLQEDNPGYSSVVDRLRSAARSERKLGRAQALLVFTLFRAGKHDEAKKELDALVALNTAHVMVRPLRALLEGKKIAASKEPEPKKPTNGKKPGPTPSPSPVNPVSVPKPTGDPGSGHFEFDKEPAHHVPAPTPEPSPDPEPAPDPAPETPAPAPAPEPPPPPAPAPIDTSDLPG